MEQPGDEQQDGEHGTGNEERRLASTAAAVAMWRTVDPPMSARKGAATSAISSSVACASVESAGTESGALTRLARSLARRAVSGSGVSTATPAV